jgi:hypothetical protein
MLTVSGTFDVSKPDTVALTIKRDVADMSVSEGEESIDAASGEEHDPDEKKSPKKTSPKSSGSSKGHSDGKKKGTSPSTNSPKHKPSQAPKAPKTHKGEWKCPFFGCTYSNY